MKAAGDVVAAAAAALITAGVAEPSPDAPGCVDGTLANAAPQSIEVAAANAAEINSVSNFMTLQLLTGTASIALRAVRSPAKFQEIHPRPLRLKLGR